MTYSVGDARRALGEATRRKVEAYFAANPYAKQTECAAHLGLSQVTIFRHFKELRAERLAKDAPFVSLGDATANIIDDLRGKRIAEK